MINLPIQVDLMVNSNNEAIELESSTVINATIISAPEYEGPYTVIPSARDAVVLETNGKMCTDDVTVIKIPTYETHNQYGSTFYIREVNDGN